MKRRRLLLLVVALVASLTFTAPPAAAGSGVTKCTFAGTVSLSPGVSAEPPIFPLSGSWVYDDVFLFCKGQVFGDASMNAAGGSGQNCGPLLVAVVATAFCGSATMTGFETGAIGNQDCSANLGGPQAVLGTVVTQPRWSWVDSSSFRGSVTEWGCSSPAPIIDERMDNGSGVIKGSWRPDPSSANVMGGQCFPPTSPVVPPIVYYCRAIVSGTMTVIDATP